MSDDGIRGFFGEFRFLSNFWPATVYLDGLPYSTVEHAFQAAKTLMADERESIRRLPAHKAGEAKRLGRRVKLRYGWDDMRLTIMRTLVTHKFTRHTHLRAKLLETGHRYLEETNDWNDRFYGVCDGVGENHLGRILMEVRTELRKP